MRKTLINKLDIIIHLDYLNGKKMHKIYDGLFSYLNFSKLILKCVYFTVMMSLILKLNNFSNGFKVSHKTLLF